MCIATFEEIPKEVRENLNKHQVFIIESSEDLSSHNQMVDSDLVDEILAA